MKKASWSFWYLQMIRSDVTVKRFKSLRRTCRLKTRGSVRSRCVFLLEDEVKYNQRNHDDGELEVHTSKPGFDWFQRCWWSLDGINRRFPSVHIRTHPLSECSSWDHMTLFHFLIFKRIQQSSERQARAVFSTWAWCLPLTHSWC